MTRCPTDTQLVAYHGRELSDADRQEIDAHLQQCEACAKRDAALVNRHESWVERLREAGPPEKRLDGLRGLDESSTTGGRGSGVPSVNHRQDACATEGGVGSGAPLVNHRQDACATDANDIHGGRDARTPQSGKDARPTLGSIAGYELERELARGGQGIVYLAVQRSTKRRVALKVLREGPFASLSARRRFEREIELVAGLRHPNIVQVFDSGVAADGRHFFVMDLIQGERLDHHARQHRLDVRARLEIFARVCDAVNYAHQRGILHRDLKPSNILVDEQGQPRILDFGLARQIAGDGEPGVTTTALIAGTLAYLSPEQARGKNDELDIRSDVYALGVVLYELLTGRHPYPVDGDMTTILNHILDTPPARPEALRIAPPAKGSAGVSPAQGGTVVSPVVIDSEVETILFTALTKERDRRYQTAGDLSRDIGHYLSGEPIDAKRDSHWYILKKTLRRYRAAATAAAVVFVVVLCSAVALGVMYHQQGQLLDEVTRQRQLANEAETQARERFEDVRTLARSFIFELNPMIARLPGSTRAQAFIVEKALDYLDRLAAGGEMGPDLKNDISAAYFTIGDIQFDPEADHLGDHAGALESYHKGLKLLTELTGPKPMDMAFLNTHWIVNMRMTMIYRAIGKGDEAKKHETRAFELAERMYALDPEDRRARGNLSFVRALQADRKRSQQQFDDALAMYAEAAALVETSDDDVLSAETRHGLAQKHGAIGQVLIQLERMEEALTEHLKCRDILSELVEANPHDARFLNDLAISQERVGFLLQSLDRMDAAIEQLELSVGISESLLKVEPNNVPARSNLMSVLSRIGEIHLARGNTDAARESFDASALHVKELHEKFPHDVTIQREWAVVHYKCSEVARHLAGREGVSPADRLMHLRTAREALRACLREFEDMHERGVIRASDAGVPDMLATEIEAIDADLSSIEHGLKDR